MDTFTVVLSKEQCNAITEAIEYSLEMGENFGYAEDEPEYHDRMTIMKSILEIT